MNGVASIYIWIVGRLGWFKKQKYRQIIGVQSLSVAPVITKNIESQLDLETPAPATPLQKWPPVTTTAAFLNRTGSKYKMRPCLLGTAAKIGFC